MPALGAVTETQLRRAGDICIPRKLGHCGAVFVLRMARQLRAKLLKPKERGSFETFWHDNQAIRAAFVGGSAVGSPPALRCQPSPTFLQPSPPGHFSSAGSGSIRRGAALNRMSILRRVRAASGSSLLACLHTWTSSPARPLR